MLNHELLLRVLNALNRLAREPALTAELGPLADELGAAMANRATIARAGGTKGKGGGRPPEWLLLEDSQGGDRWMLGHKAIADATGHPINTITNHISRSGQWVTTEETDNGTRMLRVRKPTDAEAEWLSANDAEMRAAAALAEAPPTPEKELTEDERRRLPFSDPRRKKKVA